MAQEKDITSRPKFFSRKKNVTDDQLCERCLPHKHVILIKHGCDAIMYSDVKLKSGYLAAVAAQDGKSIHFWCLEEDDPPACLAFFREIKAVR